MKGIGVWYVPCEGFIEGRGWRVSIVYEDENGHYPTGDWPNDGTGREPWFVPGPTYEEAQKQVRSMNEARGIDAEEQFRVLAASMGAGRRRGRSAR